MQHSIGINGTESAASSHLFGNSWDRQAIGRIFFRSCKKRRKNLSTTKPFPVIVHPVKDVSQYPFIVLPHEIRRHLVLAQPLGHLPRLREVLGAFLANSRKPVK